MFYRNAFVLFILLTGCADQSTSTRSDGDCPIGSNCEQLDSDMESQVELDPSNDMSIVLDVNIDDSQIASENDETVLTDGSSGNLAPDATSADAEIENLASDAGYPDDDVETITPVAEMCNPIDVVGPVLPDEANHFAATRFAIDDEPFSVESVIYRLRGSTARAGCSAILPHQTNLFIIPQDAALPADPENQAVLHRSYDIPIDETAFDGRLVEITLPFPLSVNRGDAVVVSIQMSATEREHLCLEFCGSAPASPNRTFWSNSAVSPFDWQDLYVDFGLSGAPAVGLVGRRIQPE